MAVRHVKIVNRKRGWCAVEIPRCGCTYLKDLVWQDYHNGERFSIEKEGTNLHLALGYTEEESKGKIVEWNYDTSGLFHFAVWRPPIERCVSTWLGFTKKPTAHKYLQPLANCSFDDWVNFIEVEMLREGEKIDPHLRRQIDFYHVNDVDAIVPLEMLNQWLWKKFGYEPQEKINVSARPDNLFLSPFAGERIAQLYVKDIVIPLSNKFVRE